MIYKHLNFIKHLRQNIGGQSPNSKIYSRKPKNLDQILDYIYKKGTIEMKIAIIKGKAQGIVQGIKADYK